MTAAAAAAAAPATADPAAPAGAASPPALHVVPWVDRALDETGHDPRSEYAELFWTPLLGPTSILMTRRFVSGLEREPRGFTAPVEDTAKMLGLGGRPGRNGAFQRTVDRLVHFRIAYRDDNDVLLVHRRLPTLSRTQLGKLPAPLQRTHEAWREEAARAPLAPVLRERSRTLALTLFQLGEDTADVEAHLRRLRFHPAITADALAWARAHLPKDLALPPASS